VTILISGYAEDVKESDASKMGGSFLYYGSGGDLPRVFLYIFV